MNMRLPQVVSPRFMDNGPAFPPLLRHCDEAKAAVGMRTVLDPADVESVLVEESLKRHAIAATTRHAPAFQLIPQRVRHGVRIGRQRFGDELGDRGCPFVRQAL